MARKDNKKAAVKVETDGNTVRVPAEHSQEIGQPGLTKVLEQDEIARRAKVKRIKGQLEDGTYDVDSKDVAEAIIKDTLESSKDRN
jgi:anti-sigma28 factor (negative regulator of flagellin synthesis)